MKRMLTIVGVGLDLLWSSFSFAIAPVNLGSASSFAILGGSEITNTDFSLINGNLGLHPGTAVTGFPPGTLNGTEYIAEGVALQAKNDLVTAYDDAAGRLPVTMIATELGGTVHVGGVYNSASGTFGITGTMTLDAQNDPDAVFIFQMESSLITASSSEVMLIGGAQACNVYWQVGSSATLGTNSHFVGSILALTSITVTTGVDVDGRVLARNGAVTLDTDTITVAVCEGQFDSQILLVPNNPDFPGPQAVYACATLLAGSTTQVIVPVQFSQHIPVLTISAGCSGCDDGSCAPLSDWVLGGWIFNPYDNTYVADLTVGLGSTGGCVCLNLDFVLPVEFSAFEVVPKSDGNWVTFCTASEQGIDRFEILRGASPDGQFATIATLASQGNNSTGHDYVFADDNVQAGALYWYYLADVSVNGDRTEHPQMMRSAMALDNVIPTEFSLSAYPNPFNPVTTIQFSLKAPGEVTLSIFNMEGQGVRDLARNYYDAGNYTVRFDAGDLPSGIYFARLDVEQFSIAKKMVLLK
ncbi:MAG: DUF3494 domain-containing protein [bacterium]|nr:DUF3494 domain-containing protein [bacterium]